MCIIEPIFKHECICGECFGILYGKEEGIQIDFWLHIFVVGR